MSRVCTACFYPSVGTFCGECGGKTLPGDHCSVTTCGQSGEGNFCGSCGSKRLCMVKRGGAGGAPQSVVSNESGFRPSQVAEVGPRGNMGKPAEPVPAQQQQQFPVHTDDWHVTLVNLPALPGQPLELFIGKNLAYRSEGIDCRVNHHFQTPTVGWTATNQWVLKIPAVNFTYDRSFKLDDGKYVRIAADNAGQISIRRQKWPF